MVAISKNKKATTTAEVAASVVPGSVSTTNAGTQQDPSNVDIRIDNNNNTVGAIDWSDYWNSIGEVEKANTNNNNLINQYEICAQTWLQQQLLLNNNLFSIAWAAYTILQGDMSTSKVLHRTTCSASATLWRCKLGCLSLLNNLCILTTNASTNKEQQQQQQSQRKNQSPFFPLLVEGSLATLLQHTTMLMNNNNQNEDPSDTDDPIQINSILTTFVEILLPDILGDEVCEQFQQQLSSGIIPSETFQRSLHDSVNKWTSTYIDDKYVSPLLLFPTAENDRNDDQQQQQQDDDPVVSFNDDTNQLSDIQKLINLYLNKNGKTDEATANTGINFVEPIDLLKPLKSLSVPFARPLPPPLIPMMGYDDDDDDYNDDETTTLITGNEENDILQCLHAELIWLTPSNLRLLLLPDDDNYDDNVITKFKQVLELLQKQAFHQPLAPNGQRLVMEMLSSSNNNTSGGDNNAADKKGMDYDNDDDAMTIVTSSEGGSIAMRLIRESGLTAQNLPRLVEYNPLIAYECLVRILLYSKDEEEKNEYLSSLVSMDMSLHSMEVVNRLATYNLTNNPASNKATAGSTTVPTSTRSGSRNTKAAASALATAQQTTLLHPEYIHLFIVSCIESCENVQDRHSQNRLVRLVCIFIQSLVRNKIVNVADIYFEVQSFCVEFSRIREASYLYKTLQNLQISGSGGGGGTGTATTMS